MTRIIAITNQKGGVGKTTTCVNLAAGLAEADRGVLVIDMDPQGNATMGCGVDKRELAVSTLEVLTGEARPDEAIVGPGDLGFDLMPANADLTAAEVQLMDVAHRERRLAEACARLAGRYDYILIDSPPSLSLLTVNALAAADAVLIPMQCEYYALEGLSALLDTIRRIQKRVNPRLKIEGLLRTMYDVRNNLANEVSSQLTQHFGDKVYRTIVPRNVRVAESPSYGQPVIRYDRSSRGAVAYLGLAGEFMRRQRDAAPTRPMD